MQIAKKKLGSKGFTLIELLIVIIIIGILAAIAFVAYSGSQTKAHQADAQSTVAEAKNKLAEYNANSGNYPKDQSTFTTWLSSADGGNNSDLANKFTTTNGYTYNAYQTDGTTSCSSDESTCAAFKIVADHTKFKGSENITQTN